MTDTSITALTLNQLCALTSFDRILTPDEFDYIFKVCEALWLHSGDPKDPHAELTSGNCTNGFVDVLRVLRYPNLCRLIAKQLIRQMRANYSGSIGVVVGSDHASATLSYEVASQLGTAWHDFTEKGNNKTQSWKRFQINPGEVVLQVEELITTAMTLGEVREGLRRGNVTPITFAPLVMAVVHRPPREAPVTTFEGSPIMYLRHYDIESWEPSKCPLCAAGSKRLRAKEHWDELTKKAA